MTEPRRNLSATPQPNMRTQIPTTNTNLDLTNIDHVPSSGTHSGSTAVLYVFEENDAVIKMIIKGRRTTMSRTRRVAVDWSKLILILKFKFNTLSHLDHK